MGEIFVHDERFTEAFANTLHWVYGQRLDPFCLWHQLNLELIDSPFLTGEVVTPVDLIAAVVVCSTPYSQAGYVPDLTPPRGWRKLWRSMRFARFDYRAEFHKFTAYLSDFHSGPKLWPNQHKQKESGPRDMDETLESAAHVIQETGWSEERVWTMPIGKLHWYSTAFLKLKGADMLIWTPVDEEQYQAHVARREARLAARTAELVAAGVEPATAQKQAQEEHRKRVKRFFAAAEGPGAGQGSAPPVPPRPA